MTLLVQRWFVLEHVAREDSVLILAVDRLLLGFEGLASLGEVFDDRFAELFGLRL